MGRLLAIDYGKKRTGLAVTDPLQIIATALETVPTENLLHYLEEYQKQEEIEAFIIGKPQSLQGEATNASPLVEKFIQELTKKYPQIPIHQHDERFTSKIALNAMITGGTSKKYRQNKGNLDKVSAVVILQSYMESLSA